MKTPKTVRTREKWIALLLCLVLGLFLSLTGCERNESPVKEKVPSPAVKGKEEKEEHEGGTVTLSADKQKVAGIEVRILSPEEVSVPLSATAVIELNADRVSKVSSRVTGKITRLMATQGQRVKAGQPLAYADTVEIDQAFSEYMKAKGKRELAEKTLRREELLFEKKVCPEKDVLQARQEFSAAEADLALSIERFRFLGINITQVERQRSNGGNRHPLIPIASSIGGVVIEKTVTQGEVIGPDKNLFTVADLSTLWLQIDLYEKDLARIKTGQGVNLSVTALPDRNFKGRISYMGDLLDEKTRTVKARVTVDNSGGLLKPGMFATVEIQTAVGEKKLLVSESALTMEGAAHYVFMQTAPDKFSRRDVKIGRTLGKKVEVLEGLKAGDPVVTDGAFTLKSELKKETLHADEH
jgi:cobalt-zinc-cadmium efflux system membrane fusion protein